MIWYPRYKRRKKRNRDVQERESERIDALLRKKAKLEAILTKTKEQVGQARVNVRLSRDDSDLRRLIDEAKSLERAVRRVEAAGRDISPTVKDQIAKRKERTKRKRAKGARGVSQAYGTGDSRSKIVSGGLVRPR